MCWFCPYVFSIRKSKNICYIVGAVSISIMNKIAYESIRTLIAEFFMNIFYGYEDYVTWHSTIVIVIEKFQTNQKMYIRVARHLLQTYVYLASLCEQSRYTLWLINAVNKSIVQENWSSSRNACLQWISCKYISTYISRYSADEISKSFVQCNKKVH